MQHPGGKLAPFCRLTMASASEESEVEWEEVSDEDQVDSLPPNARITTEETKKSSLQITVDQNASLAKKGRKKSAIQLAMEKYERELKQNMHKVHLLCLLLHGFVLNERCNNEFLQSVLLSLVPTACFRFSRVTDTLSDVVQWFSSSSERMVEHLRESRACHDLAVPCNPVLILVAVLRALGLNTRLVLNLDPVPFKKSAPKKKKKKRTVKGKEPATSPRRSSTSETPNSSAHSGDVRDVSVIGGRKRSRTSSTKTSLSKTKQHKRRKTHNKDTSGSEDEEDAANVPAPPESARRRSSRVLSQSQDIKVDVGHSQCKSPHFKDVRTSDSDSDFELEAAHVAGKLKRKSVQEAGNNSVAKKLKTKKESFSPNEHAKKMNTVSPTLSSSPGKQVKACDVTPVLHGARSSVEHTPMLEKQPSSSLPEEKLNPNQLLDTSKETGELYDATNSWIEVFDGEAEKWITVHLPSKSVGSPHLVELECPQVLLYVVGIDACGRVKDLTPRYAASWCTVERKGRIGEEWVSSTLSPFSHTKEEEDKEDDDIHALLLSRPMPTKKQEYRGHPLYALQSLLLKYEAIYPETSSIMGYCDSEPFFSRDCVHTLHCRENWLKEAKVVKKGETPFKIVKSYGIKKRLGEPSSDREVELFGEWQTQDYIPPPVVDGKIPRNEFGNIEVFKPSMVPKGGVHIRVPGVQKVARKLGIEYASAVVGWEFHGRYSFPWIDGVVIAQENRDLLCDACRAQEEKVKQDKQAKREKIILDRWVHFVKGVLIAQRVKRRFCDVNKHDTHD